MTPACCETKGCPPDEPGFGHDCACPWWFQPCGCELCQWFREERDAHPVELRAWARSRRRSPETRLRGIETHDGEAGWCPACERDCPDGPDACLARLPGVTHACCGHGAVEFAYVAIGDAGDPLVLDGHDALAWFAERSVGPWATGRGDDEAAA